MYSTNGLYKIITIGNVTGERHIDSTDCNNISIIPEDIQQHQILKKEDILISMTGNVGRVSLVNQTNCLLNQRVAKLTIDDPILNEYVYQALSNSKFEQQMINKGQGAAQKNIKNSDIENFEIYIPSSKDHVLKISNFLFLVDKRIEQQRQLVEALKRYKRGLLSEIFTRKIYFKNTNGVNFPKWENKSVSDVLNYEQPQKYIVASENYNDTYQTPVLTANKAFILGYTNENNGIYSKGEAIIYDDFTMDMKYVTFNFKVKSSTIKILTCKESNDLYFMYNLLLSLNLKSQGHQRSYISILEPTKILVPCHEEQILIASLLRNIDNNVDLQSIRLNILENYKKGLLQKMFI